MTKPSASTATPTLLSASLIADLLRESLQRRQTPYVQLISNSMAPLFWAGDEARIGSADLYSLAVGELVVWQTESAIFTHRLWQWHDVGHLRFFLTRGDRNLTYDPGWSAAQLIGKVIGRRRDGKILDLQTGRGAEKQKMLQSWAAREARWFGLHPPAQWWQRESADPLPLQSGVWHRQGHPTWLLRLLRKAILHYESSLLQQP